MHWFSVKILYESDAAGRTLGESSLRLILAADEAEAAAKARIVGMRDEHDYQNDSGQVVRWLFARVLEVQDLCETEIVDGMEVYSHVFTEN